MEEVLLTPEQARSQGYIPLDEATKKPRAPHHTTLWRQVKNGNKPGCLVSRGSKSDYWILETSLFSKTSVTKEKDYHQLWTTWLKGMESGIHAHKHKPVSQKYLDDVLLWGMGKYWAVLDQEPSIAGLNEENFRTVMGSDALKIDRVQRRDFHSSKMHIYRVCTRFMSFLIEKGLKTPAELIAVRKQWPGREFKPKKRILDEIQIREAIDFNKKWYDGRLSYDIDALDILMHLYAFAGLRRMEAAWLKISDIDFEKDRMLVFGKGSKERYVPLDIFPDLRPKLLDWIEFKRPLCRSELLIVQKNGKPLTETSINQRFKRLSWAMKLRKAYEESVRNHSDWSKDRLEEEAKTLAASIKVGCRPHQLRYSFATILATEGMPTTMLQRILGHEKLETTEGYINTTDMHVMQWTKKNRALESKDEEPIVLSRRSALKEIIEGRIEPVK